MEFHLDQRLESSSFLLTDWPLSRVLLKNNAHYRWFILVPRRENITELTDLAKSDRYQLIDEMNELTSLVQELFKPDKINIGTLGNIVRQFHLHVVGRFQDDPLWPQGIWQALTQEKAYLEQDALIANLVARLGEVRF